MFGIDAVSSPLCHCTPISHCQTPSHHPSLTVIPSHLTMADTGPTNTAPQRSGWFGEPSAPAVAHFRHREAHSLHLYRQRHGFPGNRSGRCRQEARPGQAARFGEKGPPLGLPGARAHAHAPDGASDHGARLSEQAPSSRATHSQDQGATPRAPRLGAPSLAATPAPCSTMRRCDDARGVQGRGRCGRRSRYRR